MTVDLKPTIVSCPKCGYAQEERSDCGKCGIVFSKYYALHNPAKFPQADGTEQPAPRPAEETFAPDTNEYRQNLIEFQRLVNAIEFERVERNRISSEIKFLDRRLQTNYEDLASRLKELETPPSEAASQPQPSHRENLAEFKKDLLEVHFEPLINRFDEIEERLSALGKDSAPKTDPRVLEVLRRFEVRVTELESRTAKLPGERADSAEAEQFAQLEKNLGEVTQELSGLKDALAGIKEFEVTGALEEGSKLVGLEARVKETFGAVSGIEQQLESSALDLKRMDLQYQSLAEGVAKAVELTKDMPQQISLLGANFASLHAECEELRDEIADILQRVEQLPKPKPDGGRAPLDEEIHTIRDNLDELLRFMGSLARKA